MNENLFLDALADNNSLVPVRAEAQIVTQWPDKSVVASNGIDVGEYERLGFCKRETLSTPRPLQYLFWGGDDQDQLFPAYEQVVWNVKWNTQSIIVVHLEWENGCGGTSRDWIVAESEQIAHDFILDIERKTNAPNESILVFSDGRWNRSRSLYQATTEASFDDLVLSGEMKKTIRTEFSQFLDSEEQYRRLGISWRRGALFIGPPGNGKTHCVRALVNELGISILYVQSLSHSYFTGEQLWQRVFDRARQLKPCVLVLEDLDSMVDDDNRSFFLNQLDGFEQNHGMIVLATTNHPERIDVAIVDRPSRFDRKYHFDLPSVEERQVYLESWQKKLADETGWAQAEVKQVAAVTKGYSFAYLKELVISSVMAWMKNSDGAFSRILVAQAKHLHRQMKTELKG